MAYKIDELPDDIISYIFSYSTPRDSLRARLSSIRWQHLPDSHPVLLFDSLNVLGKEIAFNDHASIAVQSKFVRIVDCFMEVWAGKRIHTLIVRFYLGHEHTSQINRWIATSVRMEVEEIELNFLGRSKQRYVFPPLVHFEKEPNLKRLCLRYCILQGMDFILFAAINLISLLQYCNLPTQVSIDGRRLLHLKKLTICDSLSEIKLSFPSLEVFKYYGKVCSLMFVHVPVLRKAKFWSTLVNGSCSLLFNRLTRQVPNLQALTLTIRTEVKPILSMSATCSLKKLAIFAPRGFDLLCVTNLLNASPLLETLQVQMWGDNMTSIEKREYIDHSHYKLKAFRLGGFHHKWNGMELAMYLMKNVGTLEKMFIAIPRDACVGEKVESLKQMREKINPNAQLYIRG